MTVPTRNALVEMIISLTAPAGWRLSRDTSRPPRKPPSALAIDDANAEQSSHVNHLPVHQLTDNTLIVTLSSTGDHGNSVGIPWELETSQEWNANEWE